MNEPTIKMAAGILAGFGLLTPSHLGVATAAYQECCGIRPTTGTLGPRTTAALKAEQAFQERRQIWTVPPTAEAFYSGMIGHLVNLEGTAGIPYWPGGASGVTLDPGFDLGQQADDALRRFYFDVLTSAQRNLLSDAIGKKGDAAHQWLLAHEAELARLETRIAPDKLPLLSARVIGEYWRLLRLAKPSVDPLPGFVQMGLLSLFYNTGYRHLNELEPLWVARNWSELALKIEGFGPASLTPRRVFEAELVRRTRGGAL